MQVIILKDGTVPVVVAKVIATDLEGLPEESEYMTSTVQRFIEKEDPDGDLNAFIQCFTVTEGSRFIYVTWTEDDGFEVTGFETLARALALLNVDALPAQIAASYLEEGHWSLTYDPGDNEAYGHVFALNREDKA
jgi:hypothetical protein